MPSDNSNPSVSVLIIGSGNAFAAGGRFHACYFVESSSSRFLLDCGASSIVALRKFGVDIFSLDAILVSHLHGDHFAGIPFIELVRHIERHTQKPLKIIGPAGIKTAVENMRRLMYPELTSVNSVFYEFKEGSFKVDGLDVVAIKAIHSPRTNPHSFRIGIDGRVITFSGDTEWHDGLIDLAADSDLFLCECSGLHSAVSHMSYQALISNRGKLNTRRLVLTHLGREMVELSECVFERAFDGQQITL